MKPAVTTIVFLAAYGLMSVGRGGLASASIGGLAPTPGPTAAAAPELADVGIDSVLDTEIPTDVHFTSSEGKPVTLHDLMISGKPTILTMNYYECPMLCTLVLNGVVDGIRGLGYQPGFDYEIVTVSINPREGAVLAATKKAAYLKSVGRDIDPKGWQFLVGDDANIKRLADALGFHFHYDEQAKQYAHAAAIWVLTPDAHLSRVLYGIEFPTRDLKLALLEASRGKIGSPIDKLILYCFHYDPQGRKYSLYAMNVMRLGGGITLLGIALLVLFLRKGPPRKGTPRGPVAKENA